MMFSFKSREKIKKELKKEIRDELRKEEMEKKSISSVARRIEPKKEIHNSPEDLKEIQLKFLKLSVFVVLMIVLFLLIFMYGGKLFPSKDNTKLKPNSINNEKNNSADSNEEEEKSFSDLPDGKIDITDKRIRPLYSLFSNSNRDSFLIDATFLYKDKTVKTTDLSVDQLLFLVTKTEEFKSFLSDDNLKDKNYLCADEHSISISKKEINEILFNRFNISTINYNDFNVAYYSDNMFVSYLKFKNIDDSYVSSCFNKDIRKPKVITQTLAYDVLKKGDTISIDLNTVFINSKGVYADYALKKKIKDTIGNGDNNMEYVKKGTSYRAVFKQNDQKNYYFYSMEYVAK